MVAPIYTLGVLDDPPKDREIRERVRQCLEFDDAPSRLEPRNGYTLAVWTYKDTWPHDPSPDFEMTLAVPTWYTWGKKKREAKLRELRDRSAVV